MELIGFDGIARAMIFFFSVENDSTRWMNSESSNWFSLWLAASITQQVQQLVISLNAWRFIGFSWSCFFCRALEQIDPSIFEWSSSIIDYNLGNFYEVLLASSRDSIPAVAVVVVVVVVMEGNLIKIPSTYTAELHSKLQKPNPTGASESDDDILWFFAFSSALIKLSELRV